MTETWLPIANYNNYEISSIGRVRNNKTGKILSQTTQMSGYKQVCLCENGKRKMHTIHRLVMQAFNPVSKMDSMDVNHIDYDKTNNTLDNLEWVPRRQNLINALSNPDLKELETSLVNAMRSALHQWYDSYIEKNMKAI